MREITMTPQQVRACLLEEIEGLVEDSRANDYTPEELAHLLDWFQTVKRRCRDAEVSLTNTLALMMPHNTEVYGGLVVERKGHYDREWHHDSLLWEVIREALDSRVNEHGEVVGETPDVLMEWLRDCAAISYWRIGKLKARGIDPDAFCDKSEEIKWSLTLRRPE